MEVNRIFQQAMFEYHVESSLKNYDVVYHWGWIPCRVCQNLPYEFLWPLCVFDVIDMSELMQLLRVQLKLIPFHVLACSNEATHWLRTQLG